MPAAGSDLLVDTSVAVALVVDTHDQHQATREALRGYRLGLSGHAAFETFSVLTRLPPPARRGPATIARALEADFPRTRHLSEGAAADLTSRLAELGIAGGAVYDALVGAVALEHGLRLASRDRRALDTYRALGVEVLAVGGG